MNPIADFGLDPAASLGPNLILGTFILFCRIGACLMLMPGFSSPQIPTQVRLFMALAVTLSLTPLLIGHLPTIHRSPTTNWIRFSRRLPAPV